MEVLRDTQHVPPDGERGEEGQFRGPDMSHVPAKEGERTGRCHRAVLSLCRRPHNSPLSRVNGPV